MDAFGRQAETIGQYLRKGRPVLIEGRLRLDSWEDKQSGQKRSRLGVVLESFQFLDSGGGRGGDSGGGSEGRVRNVPPSQAEPADSSPPAEDDVPF